MWRCSKSKESSIILLVANRLRFTTRTISFNTYETKGIINNSHCLPLPYRDRTRIREIVEREDLGKGLIGQTVCVAGWIKSLQKNLRFLQLGDGSCVSNIQVVMEEAEMEDEAPGSAFGIRGSQRCRSAKKACALSSKPPAALVRVILTALMTTISAGALLRYRGYVGIKWWSIQNAGLHNDRPFVV